MVSVLLGELEEGHLRTNVESNRHQMPDAAADVQVAVTCQLEFTGGVTSILNRQHRRWKKRRLTLTAMRVARKNPALVVAPDWQIDRVRIVTERDSCPIHVKPAEDVLRVEALCPQVVEAHDLQTVGIKRLIAEHRDAA